MSDSPEVIDAETDYNPRQDEVIRNIHKHLAALLPELGRDYTVSISFNDKSDPEKADVSMTGLTRIGKLFVEEAMNYFNNSNN